MLIISSISSSGVMYIGDANGEGEGEKIDAGVSSAEGGSVLSVVCARRARGRRGGVEGWVVVMDGIGKGRDAEWEGGAGRGAVGGGAGSGGAGLREIRRALEADVSGLGLVRNGGIVIAREGIYRMTAPPTLPLRILPTRLFLSVALSPLTLIRA